jgi:hypothetical protein
MNNNATIAAYDRGSEMGEGKLAIFFGGALMLLTAVARCWVSAKGALR